MSASVHRWMQVSVPLLLAAQALLVHWSAGVEYLPAPPNLSRFPGRVGSWTNLRDEAFAGDVVAALKADCILNRFYREGDTGATASVFVAWFQSQRGGARQPHSPKVCLPGSGWVPEESRDVTLDTAAGQITVNRLTVSNRYERQVVFYWYQTPRRVVAGEWEAKILLAADAVRDRRTDSALVRVMVSTTGIGQERATAAAEEFSRVLYPALRDTLPR